MKNFLNQLSICLLTLFLTVGISQAALLAETKTVSTTTAVQSTTQITASQPTTIKLNYKIPPLLTLKNANKVGFASVSSVLEVGNSKVIALNNGTKIPIYSNSPLSKLSKAELINIVISLQSFYQRTVVSGNLAGCFAPDGKLSAAIIKNVISSNFLTQKLNLTIPQISPEILRIFNTMRTDLISFNVDMIMDEVMSALEGFNDMVSFGINYGGDCGGYTCGNQIGAFDESGVTGTWEITDENGRTGRYSYWLDTESSTTGGENSRITWDDNEENKDNENCAPWCWFTGGDIWEWSEPQGPIIVLGIQLATDLMEFHGPALYKLATQYSEGTISLTQFKNGTNTLLNSADVTSTIESPEFQNVLNTNFNLNLTSTSFQSVVVK